MNDKEGKPIKQNHKLTLKQEKFCHEYFNTDGNASEAYRRVYDCENTSTEGIWTNASVLMANPKVALRIEVLRGELMEKTEISKEKVISDLKKIVDKFILDGKNTGNSLRAIEILNKMLGYYAPEKQEVTHKGIVVNYNKPLKDDEGDDPIEYI